LLLTGKVIMWIDLVVPVTDCTTEFYVHILWSRS